MREWTRRDVLWLAGAAVTSGCGYALAGRGNTLPASIVSIGVPPFVNQSPVPDVDRVLTDAVRAEFQTKGRYRILPESTGVDGLCIGRVLSVVLQPSAFTADKQASRQLIVTTASIEFTEVAAARVIWANPSFQVRDEFDITTGESANDPAALFTQDANALDRLARNFARSVVTSIFEAF
ncbi:MAG: hypothetical protein ABS36_05960 [Acidobacteria bacterium SCN 69-37]|nr:MAG: hypothetical protein ABS36_05960 [Acidobacteria bacterium SCN 69-37]